ncbi:hypothetical protein CRE_10480 [Caenorhabditis remanei]|uniref:F-box domain-containing protein n=1 Tax=Caenorhabditis remanei TaxID=31234 RepID=E3N0U2_CAERE|nr:hypothetical protein CRE_10480 [Caenorhabditis remanei]
MTTAFPLLRLPYLVLMPILEQMVFMERIALSVLSKRARMFLKLLKMKCEYTNFQLKYGTIEAEVFLDNFEVFKLEFYISGHVEFKYRQDVLLWSTMRVPPMDYAVSIMDVMHCKSIHQFTIAKISMECNTLPLLVNLPKIDRVVVYSDLYDVSPVKSRLCKVLRTVLPISSAVSFSYDVLNPKDLREIFKANFDAVTVILKDCDDDMPNHKMFCLNDLTCGLQTLRTSVDLLLNGLNAVPVPIETKRAFRVLGNIKQVPWYEKITAEFDITRADGRTATIRLKCDICDYIHFYVWPEATNNNTNLVPNQSSLISNFYSSCVHHFERLFLCFLLSCETFFFFFSNTFNWKRDHGVFFISLSLLIFLFVTLLFS